jgi:hypothetical protein
MRNMENLPQVGQNKSKQNTVKNVLGIQGRTWISVKECVVS